MNTVIHSDDINLLTHWQKSLKNNCLVFDDIDELFVLKHSLVVINYSACMSECESIVSKLVANKNSVLILHRVPSLSAAKALLKAGAMGYGNAMMRDHFIVSAINTIKDGMIWLYPELTSQLIIELPSEEKQNEQELAKLSARECDVALLLKDGCTYKSAAIKLNITPRTVKAHAGKIYSKLNVKDRLGLALLLK